MTREIVMAALTPVLDPEINLSVVDLGLIYDAVIDDEKNVLVLMTLTTPACPYGPQLMQKIQETVEGLKGVNKVRLELVWDPQWDPAVMASDYAKDVLGIW